MQSASGRQLLKANGIDPDDPATFLLLEQGRAYTDTDAALRVISRFGFSWRVFSRICSLIPRSLRNPFYRLIARNRYRWFGKRDVCFLPRADDADRFLV
jgi:predicted DCC family thiol-disulfide oxidoreductase YuxK